MPFSIKSRKDPRFYFSRKVSLEQAFIISTLRKDEAFWRLIAVGGGMFREFLVSGAFNLCLELITQVEEDSVNMSLEMYVFNPHIMGFPYELILFRKRHY